MKQYLNLMEQILHKGEKRLYRNGNRASIFNPTLSFDMADGFPIITSKKVNYKAAIAETLWFLKGQTNTKDLVKQGVPNIWSVWDLKEDHGEYKKGYIGPMYGYLWRNWDGKDGAKIDQIKETLLRLKTNPFSSRHTITAFDPKYAADDNLSPQENILKGNGCLNPCHPYMQFYVTEGPDNEKRLSLKWVQGSSDVAIGLPFNIIGYATILHLFARELRYTPHMLYFSGGDTHLYENHLKLVKEQLDRKDSLFKLPTLTIKGDKDIFTMDIDDMVITDYQHHDTISYPIS